jgi:error-prone DNA polymerase
MPELEPDAHLPPMRPGQQVIEDYRHLRLSLRTHPVAFLRSDLDRRGILAHEKLPTVQQGRRVTVAGLVLVRQRPGAGRAIFMTLEDEGGIANVIVWIPVFERYRPIVMGARLVAVTGQLQNESGVIHIVAEHMEDLTKLLSRLIDDNANVANLSNNTVTLANVKGHPRFGDALVTLLRDDSRLSDVMPKGRNFH